MLLFSLFAVGLPVWLACWLTPAPAPAPLAVLMRYRGTLRGWIPVGPVRPVADAHRLAALMARTLPTATLRVVLLP